MAEVNGIKVVERARCRECGERIVRGQRTRVWLHEAVVIGTRTSTDHPARPAVGTRRPA